MKSGDFISCSTEAKIDEIYKKVVKVDKNLGMLSVQVKNIENKTEENHSIITNGLAKEIRGLAKRVDCVESDHDRLKGTTKGVGVVLMFLTLVSASKAAGLW